MFVRPDWKDGKAYQNIDRASLTRIAWEFLRRNPQYQAAWSKYAQEVRALVAADADVADYAEYVLAPHPTQAMADAIGDNERHDELDDRLFHDLGFFAAVPGMPRTKQPLDTQYGREWGLDRMPHPLQEYSLMNFRFLRVGSSAHSPSSHSLKMLENQEGTHGALFWSKWLILQIDLTLPLEVIQSSVIQIIKSRRKCLVAQGRIDVVKSRALPNARYVEYLRILDGENAGFSASAIGQHVSPSADNTPPDRPRDKRFRAALTEAKRLQTDGYKVLPLLQKRQPERKKK